jgi:hypothetical protein
LLNVDFDRQGAIRVRDGFDNLTSSAAAGRYERIAPFYRIGSSGRQLLALRGATIEALNTSGGSVATQALGWTQSTHAFARFGGPGAEVMYIAVSQNSTNNTPYKWTGSAFRNVTPASTKPRGRLL